MVRTKLSSSPTQSVCAIKRFFFAANAGSQLSSSLHAFLRPRVPTHFQHCSPSRAQWHRIVLSRSVGIVHQSESTFHNLQPEQPEHRVPSVVGHHLGRYSCGSLLKFLLWSAWSTVLMNESMTFLMAAVNGSKDGCLAPERLK